MAVTNVSTGTDTLSAAASSMSDGDVLVLDAGVYTQTVAVVVPTGVKRFAIVGRGPELTKVAFSGDTDGIKTFVGTTGGSDDNNRTVAATLRAFAMIRDYNSNARVGITVWGHSYDQVKDPYVTIEDVHVVYGDTYDKCWSTGIELINCRNVNLHRVFCRGNVNARTNDAIRLESCVNVRLTNCFVMCSAKGLNVAKANDNQIYGSYKHGSEDVTVDGCTFNIVQHGIYLGVAAFACDIHNTEVSRPSGDGIAEEPGTPGGYHNITNVYADNDDNMSSGSHFISLSRPGSIVHAAQLSDSSEQGANGVCCNSGAMGCRVTDSDFRGFGYSGSAAIVIFSDNCTIQGNVFRDSPANSWNVYINSGVNRCLAIGNQFDRTQWYYGSAGSPDYGDANAGHNRTR